MDSIIYDFIIIIIIIIVIIIIIIITDNDYYTFIYFMYLKDCSVFLDLDLKRKNMPVYSRKPINILAQPLWPDET